MRPLRFSGIPVATRYAAPERFVRFPLRFASIPALGHTDSSQRLNKVPIMPNASRTALLFWPWGRCGVFGFVFNREPERIEMPCSRDNARPKKGISGKEICACVFPASLPSQERSSNEAKLLRWASREKPAPFMLPPGFSLRRKAGFADGCVRTLSKVVDKNASEDDRAALTVFLSTCLEVLRSGRPSFCVPWRSLRGKLFSPPSSPRPPIGEPNHHQNIGFAWNKPQPTREKAPGCPAKTVYFATAASKLAGM
jgi:hypothetical protein